MTTHITKTWVEDGKLITEVIEEKEIYKQEPVAWLWELTGEVTTDPDRADGMWLPLYTTPPQHSAIARTAAEGEDSKAWVGLESEDRLCAKYMQDAPDGIEAVIDYIEAKLKAKNERLEKNT